MTVFRAGWIAVFLATTWTCGGAGGSDSGGVPVPGVKESRAGFSGVAAFGHAEQERSSFRVSEPPRLQIGSVDGGESSFFRIADVTRLQDGRLLVANAGSGELKFFGPRGEFLRSLGRRGEGPGEFRNLKNVVELESGGIAVFDVGLGRVTVFSGGGDLERAYDVTRKLGEIGIRIHMFGFLPNGNLVGLREVDGEGTEVVYGTSERRLIFKSPVVQPVLIDTAGRAIPFGRPMPGDEVVSQVESGMVGGRIGVRGVGQVPFPFLKSAMVAVRGDLIAVGQTSRALPIFLYNSRGRTIAGFGRAPVRIEDGRTQEAWVDEWLADTAAPGERREWRQLYEAFISSASAPATMPAFRSLLVQAGEKIWAEVHDPAVADDAPSRWDIFAPTGRLSDVWVGVLPPRFRPHEIGSDYVLGVWKDELGIEYVRVYDLIEVPPGR
ncbi:MAG: hypothetical protein OXH46_07055 [Gemmatimonadetes bacterium]|nr:hypothetical protein [Gemmatimonadota bacterium]